jgi:hypothetical protein
MCVSPHVPFVKLRNRLRLKFVLWISVRSLMMNNILVHIGPSWSLHYMKLKLNIMKLSKNVSSARKLVVTCYSFIYDFYKFYLIHDVMWWILNTLWQYVFRKFNVIICSVIYFQQYTYICKKWTSSQIQNGKRMNFKIIHISLQCSVHSFWSLYLR